MTTLMPRVLRSPGGAAQGPCVESESSVPQGQWPQHSGPVPALYQWEALVLACRTDAKWPFGLSLDMARNSLAAWVTSCGVCLLSPTERCGRAPPSSSALLPRGDRLSVVCGVPQSARRVCKLVVKNVKHFWILLDEWQINDNSEVINGLT